MPIKGISKSYNLLPLIKILKLLTFLTQTIVTKPAWVLRIQMISIDKQTTT